MCKLIELSKIMDRTTLKYSGKRKVWVLAGVTKTGKVISLLGDDLLDCINQLGGVSR